MIEFLTEPFGSLSKKAWLAFGGVGVAAAFSLCSYELVRSTSETLFKETYGKEKLPNVYVIVPVGVLVLLELYGRILSKLGPRKTLLATSLASCAGIIICYAAIHSGIAWARGVLYVLREAYIVLLIEQYWSFLNSTLNTGEGKFLNGPICGIGSLGAWAGGTLVSKLSQPLGSQTMLILSAVAIVPAALASDFAYARCGEPQRNQAEPHHKGALGLSQFETTPVLFPLLLIVLTTQVISTVLGLSFQNALSDAIPNTDAQNAYSGAFYANLSIVSFVMQFVAAPFMLRLLPLIAVHCLIPLVHIAAVTWFILHPSLQSAAIAFLIFKAFDYSIFRAAKELLYVPLSYDARYRAKELIDVFGYRFSKGGTALAIVVAKQYSAISNFTYAAVAVSSAAVWCMLLLPIAKFFKPTDARTDAIEEKVEVT